MLHCFHTRRVDELRIMLLSAGGIVASCGVSIMPGYIKFTRTPSAAYSCAAALLIILSAPLAAWNDRQDTVAIMPRMEEILTIAPLPLARRCGIAARIPSQVPI